MTQLPAFHGHVRARGIAARFEATSLPEPGALGGPESLLAVADLERALARLSNEDRELLLLVGVEDLSHAEAAKVLGVDQATVRKRVSRARARLAQTLDEQGTVGHTERQANDRVR